MPYRLSLDELIDTQVSTKNRDAPRNAVVRESAGRTRVAPTDRDIAVKRCSRGFYGMADAAFKLGRRTLKS